MASSRVAQLRHWFEHVFPERHIYLRSGGETRGYILTTGKQMLLASGAAVLGAWLILASASMAMSLFVTSNADQEISREHARAERQIADLKARYVSAVT